MILIRDVFIILSFIYYISSVQKNVHEVHVGLTKVKVDYNLFCIVQISTFKHILIKYNLIENYRSSSKQKNI